MALSAPLYPSDFEQYLLELTNRARSDPAAEAARYGISLSEGLPAPLNPSPRPPLAFDLHLVDAARRHSQDMIDHDFFGHISSSGDTAEDRARIAGYRAIAGIGENISWQGNTLVLPNSRQAVDSVHQQLFVDSAQPGRGHRLNILSAEVKEVGFGLATGDWTSGGHVYKSLMTTQDFTRSSLSPILTGVVYRDSDRDNFYSPGGEGIGGVTITAESPMGLVLQTTSFPSGGYSLTVIPGPYHVTFEQAGIEIKGFDVLLGQENLKLDMQLLEAPEQSVWTNPVNALDVNADGRVEAVDVLVLVNQINLAGGGELPAPGALAPPPYFDVSGDNALAALDVLMVVNQLNGQPALNSSAERLTPFPLRDTAPFVVPEPTTWALALASAAPISAHVALRRRKRARTAVL